MFKNKGNFPWRLGKENSSKIKEKNKKESWSTSKENKNVGTHNILTIPPSYKNHICD